MRSELAQRKIWYSAVGLPIHDDLIGAVEETFHGFQIHAFARYVRRFLVLIEDFQEARCLTSGFRHRLFAIGFRGLQDLRRTAARLGHNAIGVGLGFVLRAFKVRARRLHVTCGVDHLRRIVNLLQLDLLDDDARPVKVERPLHQVLYRGFGDLPRAGQQRLDG